MVFDLFRDNGRLDLHFICDDAQHLHKEGTPQVNAISIRVVLLGMGKPASHTTSVSVCPRREITDEISELRTVPFSFFLHQRNVSLTHSLILTELGKPS